MTEFGRYLNQHVVCSCGQRHFVPIEKIVVDDGALEQLVPYVAARFPILIVDDDVTKLVLGDRVEQECCYAFGESYVHHLTLKNNEHLVADQVALDKVKLVIEEYCPNIIIAVGSGTVTDIVRYSSYLAGKPFISVPTAPSVDGYASGVAALQLNGMKVTNSAQSPIGIFAMPSILSQAPFELIQAGFGDLVGKVTSLLDWKLAHVLYDETWCDEAFHLVNDPLRFCIEHAEQIKNREASAITELFKGLVSSGIAMALLGNSRPASGCEHHFSHYWDYKAYLGTRPYRSHGLQVGFATHFTMHLYEHLTQVGMLHEPTLPSVDPTWMDDLRSRWGDSKNAVSKEQQEKVRWLKERKNFTSWSNLDGTVLMDKIGVDKTFLRLAHQALLLMGIKDKVPFVDVDDDLLEETVLHANEVRARFTLLDFYQGQNLLHSSQVDEV